MAGRELLRGLLEQTGWAKWTGVDHLAGGRPVLRGRQDVGVSISHSGTWVMAGVAREADIGVDVETVSAVFDQPALERRACSPGERRSLRGHSRLARRCIMADLWTTKEAVLKARGVGLLADPRKVSVRGFDSFRVASASTGLSASVAVLRRPQSGVSGGSGR
ncbi:4'-phosphopantetheinyl transferase family protein [Curtobacterium flaccumfaciens]|uniref:4'-phosphopantetheinyl transferase family protein n=1 Tax=Curtobacterium flaccumfaciens TaxID=2035 RepID=UPI001375AFE1|nr:4'-phosphopantetheinyl transferase superfamily protein [Curtobacterium flaccumfaciens]